LNDLFLAVIDQDVVVDVFFTEFVFDDRNLLAVCFGQYAFEQRGFAAAKKTGKDGDGNEAHQASVASLSSGVESPVRPQARGSVILVGLQPRHPRRVRFSSWSTFRQGRKTHPPA